jgi:hypothetical protein
MKNKNKFGSYAEALKRLDLLSGQEQLQEATKYVLKQNKIIMFMFILIIKILLICSIIVLNII